MIIGIIPQLVVELLLIFIAALHPYRLHFSHKNQVPSDYPLATLLIHSNEITFRFSFGCFWELRAIEHKQSAMDVKKWHTYVHQLANR